MSSETKLNPLSAIVGRVTVVFVLVRLPNDGETFLSLKLRPVETWAEKRQVYPETSVPAQERVLVWCS